MKLLLVNALEEIGYEKLAFELPNIIKEIFIYKIHKIKKFFARKFSF